MGESVGTVLKSSTNCVLACVPSDTHNWSLVRLVEPAAVKYNSAPTTTGVEAEVGKVTS